jgi:hypothetical protein
MRDAVVSTDPQVPEEWGVGSLDTAGVHSVVLLFIPRKKQARSSGTEHTIYHRYGGVKRE